MKLNRKWLLAIALVLSLTMAISGTLAYLTDRDTVENVFTMGNVDIEVEEEFDQNSPLYPGIEVDKEAGIKNTHATEPAYVWMVVSVPEALDQYIKLGWADSDSVTKLTTSPHEGYIGYLVKYPTALAAGSSTGNILETVKLAANVDYQNGQYVAVSGGQTTVIGDLSDVKIMVDGFAIQTEGFNGVDAAYTAYTTQWGGLTGGDSGVVDGTPVKTLEDLQYVFANGGTATLVNDITLEKITPVEAGKEVYLNLNGKTITVDQNTTSNTLIGVKDGAKLVIDGNGTIDLEDVSTMAIFCPYGELVIENGTFKRNEVTTVTDKTTGLFMGAKNSGCNVTINGGYFDPGYYDANAADIEEILAGTKKITETDDDIAKRGLPGDKNLFRVAVKDNVSVVLNHSGYGSFKVYGGTFVGANPAWGDEGCMLPTTPDYLRPWSYYQGSLLDGQTFHENELVIPDGYTITRTMNDDVPVYTVSYSK